MGEYDVTRLLEALRSADVREAWATFLELFSPVLYQAAAAYSANQDDASDCYLYICEHLSQSRFRRLLKFDPKGRASFVTWLRVVARNLCLDWCRSQSGRPRPFRSVQRLSPLEIEVYNCRFVRGVSHEETLHALEASFPGVGSAELSEIEVRLHRRLSSRQQWILSTRKHVELSSVVAIGGEETEPGQLEIADPTPDPEAQFSHRQRITQLTEKLAALAPDERLLVQLRYEQDLSLEEIARLCELGDAQRAHRRLTVILNKLRNTMR